MHINVCVCVHVYVCVCTCACKCVCTWCMIHTYIHTYKHNIYINTRIYIHVYIYLYITLIWRIINTNKHIHNVYVCSTHTLHVSFLIKFECRHTHIYNSLYKELKHLLRISIAICIKMSILYT